MINQIIEQSREDKKSAVKFTENGAAVHATSGRKLLDMNFKVASYRSMSEDDILNDFIVAFNENPQLAVKWLFYVRDVREGLGERRLFRVIIKDLADYANTSQLDKFLALVHLIPEYGRYDDLLSLIGTDKKIEEYVIQFIVLQLGKDAENMAQKKPISLLAKWLPSENATSVETIKLARKLISAMGIKASTYRKQLSAFRKYIDVTEVKTSANKWDQIDYQKVPSRANVKYNKAFYKHDLDRREAFIEKVSNGEAKINSSVNFPHDIVHMYDTHSRITKVDPAVEALWKALPNYGIENTLVVADGSGSMTATLGKTNISALEVANALAIYCAEHNKGEYYNKYITFSETPQFVIFNDDMALSQKLDEANRHNEVANTNIEAVFDLILKTAVNKNVPQEEFPRNVLIISDMEFDSATGNGWNGEDVAPQFKKLFEVIDAKYGEAGYVLPRLCFWNVNSRTNGIPITENEAGISLVSGFSPAIIKMVMSNCLDPFEALLEVLNGDRYSQVNW
jgi:hypothetical protein